MILTCTRDSKWQTSKGIEAFVKDQDLIVGQDISDKIAEDMLRCEYAVPKQDQRIEKKDEPSKSEDKHSETKEPEEKVIAVVNEQDILNMNDVRLEAYAREHLGIELDRRKSLGKLHKIVLKKMKENK